MNPYAVAYWMRRAPQGDRWLPASDVGVAGDQTRKRLANRPRETHYPSRLKHVAPTNFRQRVPVGMRVPVGIDGSATAHAAGATREQLTNPFARKSPSVHRPCDTCRGLCWGQRVRGEPLMPADKITRRRGLRSGRWQKVERLTAVESELRQNLALAFHDAAQKPWCSVCHKPSAPLHAHHLIEASFLRREFKNRVDPLRMMAIQYDVRNCIGVCDLCHGAHHGPSLRSPITRAHVPESAYEAAHEWDQFIGDERFTVRLEMYRVAA